jgi:hypothetical protein
MVPDGDILDISIGVVHTINKNIEWSTISGEIKCLNSSANK